MHKKYIKQKKQYGKKISIKSTRGKNPKALQITDNLI